MPAAPLPTWPWIAIQIGNTLLFLFALVHGWRKQGRSLAFAMLAMVLFGFVVEYFAMSARPQPYCYTQALVWLPGGVPLGVCLSWGLIFGASFQAAQALTDSPWLRPLVAGFLAVSIDLVLDPSFVHLKFWVWNIPGAWFGIPWSNYAGWFTIVAGMSSAAIWGYRWFPAGQKLWRDILVALLTMLPAFGAFLAVVKVYTGLTQVLDESLVVSLFFAACVFPLFWRRAAFRRDRPKDAVVLAVPAYFYACGWIVLYVSGLYKVHPELILVVPITVILGLLGFLWSSLEA